MQHQKKTLNVIVLLTFLVSLVDGPLLCHRAADAYDGPPKDQDHGGARTVPDPGEPGWAACSAHASPVNAQTGDYLYSHRDLYLEGRGIPLEITRTYNSRDRYDGPFGYGWKFNLEMKLYVSFMGATEVVRIRQGDGVRIEFTRQDDGSYEPEKGWWDTLVKNTDGGFTWTQGRCSGGCGLPKYTFDGAGYLRTMDDPNGNRTTMSYDATGKLKTVTDASGRKLVIAYGTNNKIAMVTDPANRTFSYGYDANGNLTSYTDPSGRKTTCAYDSLHRLTSVTDARGNTETAITYDEAGRVATYSEGGGVYTMSYSPSNKTSYKRLPTGWSSWTIVYNSAGQPVSRTDPLYGYTSYTYDDKLRLTHITDPLYKTTTFEYDGRDNRTKMTDPLGNSTTFTYHATFNKITSQTDALGRKTTFTHDVYGNLAKITDATGNSTSLVYNQNGQLIQMTNPLGYVTNYAYDNYGYLSSVTDAAGNVTTYVHDVLGNLIEITNAAGGVSKYTYNVMGYITSFTDPLGNKTSYAYDANYNLIKITDAAGNITSYEYDAYDRLVKEKDPLGNETVRSFDVYGNLVSEKDPNGNVTQFTYDLLNRLTRKTHADGTSVSYAYDRLGNPTTVQDAKGNATGYQYDALGRMIQITHADGGKETFAYDKVGNMISRTDRKGNVIGFAFDSLNRVKEKVYPGNIKATFAYDALSRLTLAENAASKVTYGYDKMNRVVKATQDGKSVTYAYDKMGNRVKLIYPGGDFVRYAHDASGRLQTVSDSDGKAIATFTHDKLARRTKLQLSNDTESSYQYDKADRMTGLTHKRTSTGKTLASFVYGYDMADQRESLTTLAGQHDFSYDKKYQLTGATHPSAAAASYSYDAAGNRISTVDGGTTAYTVNNMNQYTVVGGVGFSYDQNGNLISDGANTYDYDFDNNLVKVQTAQDTITFEYDALGRRVSKSVDGNVTAYLYDGDHVLAETIPSGNTYQYLYGARIDEVLRMVKTGAGTKYFYHGDALGSVRLLTSATGGIVEQYAYDPFGQAQVANGAGTPLAKSAVGNPLLFTGRALDAETGLYHYRARSYDPGIGRFLQPDPVGQFLGGENLYAYVFNNPVNAIDPYGLYDWGYWKTKLAWGGAFIVAGGVVIFSGGLAAPLVAGTLAGTGVYVAHEAGQRKYQRQTLPCELEGWGWVLLKGVGTGLSGASTGVMVGRLVGPGLKEALGIGTQQTGQQILWSRKALELFNQGNRLEAEWAARRAGYSSLDHLMRFREQLFNAFKNRFPPGG
jgi:RHS repeat-associated protein